MTCYGGVSGFSVSAVESFEALGSAFGWRLAVTELRASARRLRLAISFSVTSRRAGVGTIAASVRGGWDHCAWSACK